MGECKKANYLGTQLQSLFPSQLPVGIPNYCSERALA